MSWQAATLLALAGVLACGFAWFERRRPSSRLIALVAALAALAVAGRLALAPFPNVVATTDIAFITGFALGPAPGFAVGALAAPVSNIWLGQGPWTIWEMAGWGMAGLAGALFAALWRRRPSRLPLALACAAVGLLYGLLLDLSVMVSYGGEQSLDRYLALSARGLPFNIAHAAGNFAIAFAAGPALVAMIARYQDRMRFRWHPAGALPAIAVAATFAVAAVGSPAGAEAAGVRSAVAWLEQARGSDGGYGAGPGVRKSPSMTGWAMLGMEAGGRNPLDVGPAGATPVDYLRERAERIRSAADLERSILALEGAGLNARRFAGRDLVRELTRRQAGDGSFEGQVNLTAYGILALRAAGERAGVGAAASWLERARNGDGGWGSMAGHRSDPDSTGAAMQGLAAAGRHAAVRPGIAYLRRTQKPEGGWGFYETGVTNSQSTAWAIQGLVAARVAPGRVKRRGRSGLDYLAARQNADGSYDYSSSSSQTPVWVTAQVLLAVTREALPIEPVPRAPNAAPRPQPDIESGGAPGSGGAGAGPAPAARGGAASSDGRDAARRGGKRRAADRAKADPGIGRGSRARREQRRLRAGIEAIGIGRPAAQAGEDAGRTKLLVGGGLGGLAAALGAGFVWYRRRLP